MGAKTGLRFTHSDVFVRVSSLRFRNVKNTSRFLVSVSAKNLFPNISIPIFAFEQLPFGEAFEAEGCDIHGFGFAIED